MEDFARLPGSERRDIILEAAIALDLDATIVEKDFWVCWSLKALFSLPIGHAPLVFKGGTSLSKAYSLIQRFSEDIDVVTNITYFLARGSLDPEASSTKTQRTERMQALDVACASYIATTLRDAIYERFQVLLEGNIDWHLALDTEDRFGHTLLFQYPTSMPGVSHTYIRERVKMEFGWRSSTSPTEIRAIGPYLADCYPDLIDPLSVKCTVLSPARTFWEKVTALHAQSFRDEVPRFFSRHYSDVAAIFTSTLGLVAARDFGMLTDVRAFKQMYYPSAWARYDLAVPGSLSIVPREEQKLRALRLDYRDMRMMFFKEPMPFDKMIQELQALQNYVNSAANTALL